MDAVQSPTGLGSDMGAVGNPSSEYLPVEGDEMTTAELRETCIELWETLQKTHDELQSDRTPITAESSELRLQVGRAKERQLRAEIEHIKQKPPDVLPQNPVLQYEMLKQDLMECNEQLQETLDIIKSQKKTLLEEISRNEECQAQLTAVNESLKKKVKSPSNPENISETSYLQELDAKKKKAELLRNKLGRQLISFVNKHFPLPVDATEVQGKSKKRVSALSAPKGNMVSLQSMLEDLLNSCIETPNDAYITITNRHWPPYIELLLRSQIILYHPDDPKRIKMVPFHL